MCEKKKNITIISILIKLFKKHGAGRVNIKFKINLFEFQKVHVI